jgi:uncharacterized protein YcfJ
MSSKKILFVGGAALASIACTSMVYADDTNFYDYAKVIDVQQMVDVVRVPVKHQECWDEEVHHSGRADNVAPALVGGAVGGILGHQVGKGSGRDAATIAGALLGGAVASNAYDRPADPGYNTVEQHCRPVTEYREEERVHGYRVTYRYRGETFTTVMDHDPGDRVRVGVDVRPAE